MVIPSESEGPGGRAARKRLLGIRHLTPPPPRSLAVARDDRRGVLPCLGLALLLLAHVACHASAPLASSQPDQASGSQEGSQGGSQGSQAAPLAGVSKLGIAYEVRGAGPAVVFLHAFTLDQRQWEDAARALAAHHRVVRYDQRGSGKSPLPAEPFAAHDDLLALLDELGMERASLVGLSSGAGIAADFALTHPARVEKLILASPSLGGYVPQESFEWMTPIFAAARAGNPQEAAQLFADSDLMTVRDDEQSARVRQMIHENSALWAMTRNPIRPLSPPTFERLEVLAAIPTLAIIGGKDSKDVARIADALVARAGATKVEIEGAHHLLSADAPAEFLAAVSAFLRPPSPR